jgi:uncharacterized protein (TIGR02271 family)
MATSTERTHLVGVFETRAQAERAIDALQRAGFRDDQIGVAARHADAPYGTTDLAGDEAGAGAATGAVTGGVIGGLLGAAAAGLIPGIGPVLAGGILAGVLGGAATGAVAGGLLGALVGLGIPEEEATFYNEEFEAGRVIVTVKTDGRYADAQRILRDAGAYDLGTRRDRASFADSDWSTAMPRYRSRWQERFGSRGGTWEDYEPHYRYGWEMSAQPRYRGRAWADVEPDLRRDWETRYPDKPWDRAGEAIRDTWDDLTGGRERDRVGASSDWTSVGSRYRSGWEQKFGSRGGTWNDYEPHYRYGWEMRGSDRFRGRNWTDVEPDLRRDWETRYRDKPWDQAHAYVRDAWDNFEGVTVELREEKLGARKERVEAGEVRLRKDVVAEERSIEVPVTREEVYLDRQAVDRRPASGPIGEASEVIQVPVYEEQVSAEKQTVVREEIGLGKREVQGTEQVSGTVRREEAHIEQTGDVRVRGDRGPTGHEHRFENDRCLDCGESSFA